MSNKREQGRGELGYMDLEDVWPEFGLRDFLKEYVYTFFVSGFLCLGLCQLFSESVRVGSLSPLV